MFDVLSAKDVIIILTGNILCTTSRLLFPLFLGYLVSKLMSTEAENTYQLYACALAMCVNGLVGGLGMHQRSYRCEILGIKPQGRHDPRERFMHFSKAQLIFLMS